MREKINSQFKIGTILSYASILVSLGSGLLITPFIIRTLNTSQYGLYSLVGSLVGYLSILEGGIGTTVVRYISKYKNEDEKEVSNLIGICKLIYFIISILIFILGIYLYIKIEVIFKYSMTNNEIQIAKKLFIILLINLCITTYYSVYNAIIISYERFIFSKIISIMSSVMKIILTISLLNAFPNAIFLTGITMIISIFSSAINFIYANRIIKSKIYYYDKKLFKDLFLFTSFNFIQIIIYQIYWKIDELLIGVIMSTSAVAIYSLASTLNGFIINFSTAICSILLPSVTEIRNSDKNKVTDYIGGISSIILFLYTLIVAGFISFGREFISLWVGQEYSIVYYIIIIISLSNIVNIFQEPLFVLARASNKHGKLNIILLFTSILNIVLTIFLIRQYGIIGATIGTSLAIILGNTIIGSIYFSKYLNVDMKQYYKKVFLEFKYFIMLLSPIIIVFKYISITYINSWISIIVNILIFSIIYTGSFMFIKKIISKTNRHLEGQIDLSI